MSSSLSDSDSGPVACLVQSCERLSVADSDADSSTADGFNCADTALPDAYSGSGLADESSSLPVGIFLHLLPSEVLFHICSFLEAKFLVQSMSLVCKRFHHIFSDDRFWKARLHRRWQKKYPPVAVVEGEFDWTAACVECERQRRRWSQFADEMCMYSLSAGDFPVDAVQVLQQGQLVATGDRNRTLQIFDITRVRPDETSHESCHVFDRMNAHQGWIWSMSSLDNILITGGWDTHIKFWDLTSQQVVNDIKLSTAVLCIHMERDCLVAGGFDGFTYFIDPRSSVVTLRRRYHRRSVLSIAVDVNHVMSVGEDSVLAVVDRRNNEANRVTLTNKASSLSRFDNELWIGDVTGRVSLMDTTAHQYKLVQEYDVGHQNLVSGVIRTPGALFTCSFDGCVKVLEPTQHPSLVTDLHPSDKEIAKMSYLAGVLACGCASGVTVFCPKSVKD